MDVCIESGGPGLDSGGLNVFWTLLYGATHFWTLMVTNLTSQTQNTASLPYRSIQSRISTEELESPREGRGGPPQAPPRPETRRGCRQ